MNTNRDQEKTCTYISANNLAPENHLYDVAQDLKRYTSRSNPLSLTVSVDAVLCWSLLFFVVLMGDLLLVQEMYQHPSAESPGQVVQG